MHYYMHFYCMITYNLLQVFLLHVMTILLHNYILECNEIQKAGAWLCTHTHTHTDTHTHFSVGANRSQQPSEHVQMSNSYSSLLTEGNTAGVLISDDSVAGHTQVY